MIRFTNKIESACAIFSYPTDTQRETDYKVTIYNNNDPVGGKNKSFPY